MFTLNNAFVKPISTFSLANLRFAFSPDETHFRAVGQARCARDRPHLPLLAVDARDAFAFLDDVKRIPFFPLLDDLAGSIFIST